MIHFRVTYTERGQLKVYNRVVANSFSIPKAEGSVLLFILQRTVGWRKVWEAISTEQFVGGVFRRSGGKRYAIVRGTELSPDQVMQAITSLLAMGAIEREEQGTRTIYRIVPEWLHPDLRGGPANEIWEINEGDYIYHAE